MPQLLEHETKGKCNKAKAAPASTSGTLGPSTTGHGPGMPIEIDGPADATTAALAAALDAALAATATQHSGNSGADSKRKRRELGAAFELPESIVRPSPSHNEPVYERIEGITRSYQYYMIKEGDVLVRRHSCWCLACMQAAMSGHAGLSSEYVTEGCGRGASNPHLYEYANKNCRVKQGAGVGGPDELARRHGHETAAELAVAGGQWVLVEAFDEDEFGDEVWLGRTVPLQRFGGKCCRQMSKKTTLHGDESRSTAYSSGDYAIAIEWYERVEGGLDRRAFISGDGVVYLANSTEFRRIVALGGVTEQQSHGNGGSGGDDGDEPTFVLERQERGGLGLGVVQVSGATLTHGDGGGREGLLPPLAAYKTETSR